MGNLQVLFTSGDVRRMVGISQRQLAYWDQSGLVRPNGRFASGHGSRRLYTVFDVLQLKIIRRLREAGISLQRIREALEFVASLHDEPAPLAELEILSDGHRVLVRRSDESLIDPMARQFVLRLTLVDLLTEIRNESAPSPSQMRQMMSQYSLIERD